MMSAAIATQVANLLCQRMGFQPFHDLGARSFATMKVSQGQQFGEREGLFRVEGSLAKPWRAVLFCLR